MVLVVLCCASGKVKIGAGLVVDVWAGHVLLRRGAEALGSFPFLAFQPGRQAHGGELAKTLTRSSSLTATFTFTP